MHAPMAGLVVVSFLTPTGIVRGGGFTPAAVRDVGKGYPYFLSIGDLDGVNGPDLAVANFLDHTVRVLLNSGLWCPTDIDGSGATDFADLLALLANWGPCPECSEDLDGDDSVGFSDLLIVLSNWGPCT